MLRRNVALGAALAAALTLAAPACGDDGESDPTDVTDTADVDLTGRSVYTIEIVDQEGNTYDLDRDLTGSEAQRFAFGSTHIAPAVSLAMGDNVSAPATINVDLNFGIVVAGGEYPDVHVDGPDTYAFDDAPPNVRVALKGLEYDSREPGATGAIEVTDWGVNPGDVVAGSFSGTLVQDREGGTPRTMTVSGTFHFTLPARQNGQPR